MTDLPRQEIEGKLNAHREILVSLLAAVMMGPDTVAGIVQNLEQDVFPTDGAEDPGLTPSAGYASGAEKSDEIRAILAAARERASAIKRLRGENAGGSSS